MDPDSVTRDDVAATGSQQMNRDQVVKMADKPVDSMPAE